MFTAKMYHQTIHTNLCLLKEKGHKISFEEGMFRERNQPGFEKVGHALLTVIDPDECKKTIPWPLLNDKIAKNSFRINFAKFIKMINKKYPDAKIPELTASNLQHPGGDNFLQFMYKLTTFVVKLELDRMIGSEELNKICPQPNYSMVEKDSTVMLKVMDGVHDHTELSTQLFLKYESSCAPKLQQLKSINKHLTTEIMDAQKNLEKEMKQLPQSVMERQQNIEDDIGLSEWNIDTENKIRELEISSDRLCKARDVTVNSSQLINFLEKTSTDTLCMDGHQLLIPPDVDRLAGSPVMNARGQVRLEVLLKAGAAAAHSLAPRLEPIPQTTIGPSAHSLLTDFRQQGVTATETTQSLLKLCAESKEAIEKHMKIIKSEMKKIDLPEHLLFLDDTISPLQFICEDSNQLSPLQTRKRISLNTMLNLHHDKRRKVICSIRKRRSLSKYSFETPSQKYPRTLFQHKSRTIVAPRYGFRAPSTCVSKKAAIVESSTNYKCSQSNLSKWTVKKTNENILQTQKITKNENRVVKAIPACKKSIYGKLPTGSRVQDFEDFAELPLSEPLVFERSSCELASEQSSPTGITTQDNVPMKKPRKSIQDLIERYNKLKTSHKKTPSK